MDIKQRDFLSVIKSGLLNESFAPSDDFDIMWSLQTAMRHHLDVLFYYGITKLGLKVPDVISAEFQARVYELISVSARQDYEAEELYRKFNENDIRYMPLKGDILKQYFPSPDMRYMGDVDILIVDDEYNKIKEIMQSEGYSFVVESNHEYVWNKENALHVELHKRLIPSYNKDYYSYYGDGWRLAKTKGDKGYVMSDEDFFIYMFTHLAKHYRDSGIGIKHFIDLRVYMTAKPDLDYKYIENELGKLQLKEFYDNSIALLKVWFDGAESNGITDVMTQWIFSSGAYGTAEKAYISNVVKQTKSSGTKNMKKKLYMKRIFPGTAVMKQKYPILKNHIYLMPFMWVYRIFEIVFLSGDKFKVENEKIKALTEDSITEFEDALNFVGLDFNFKE